MAAIAAPLFGAPIARPSCTARDGAPIRYEAKPLSLEDAGGRYVPMVGWPARGAPMVGSLQYGWGFLLTFHDARLQRFDRPTPGLHSATSGCWVGYHVTSAFHDDGTTYNVVGDASYVLNPWAPNEPPIFENPTRVPKIPGYRYVSADKAFNSPYEWIGVWAADHAPRSEIVAFNEGHSVVLATLPFKLTGITTLPAPDASPVGITIVGDRSGGPVPLINLVWVPGAEKSTR